MREREEWGGQEGEAERGKGREKAGGEEEKGREGRDEGGEKGCTAVIVSKMQRS